MLMLWYRLLLSVYYLIALFSIDIEYRNTSNYFNCSLKLKDYYFDTTTYDIAIYDITIYHNTLIHYLNPTQSLYRKYL